MHVLASDIVASPDTLRAKFNNAQPFRHWVIDSFLAPKFAQDLLDQFPAFERGNARNEDGMLGGKSVVERIRDLGPAYAALDDLVKSGEFLGWLSAATGIPDLRYDPWYFGGGTHENRHGQDLDPHVDFNRHPEDMSHRRLNLIVYLNPEWQDDWGGSLELHSDPRRDDNAVRLVTPLFNRAVLFETTETSWHGFSRIQLPGDRRDLSRRSIALYFYTRERPVEETAPTHSTIYVDRPLPERFRAGHVLDQGDVDELKNLLARRDQHNQRLYRDVIEAQQRAEAASGDVSNVGHVGRLFGGMAALARGLRRDGLSAATVKQAFVPFAQALPTGPRQTLRRAWRFVVRPSHTLIRDQPEPRSDVATISKVHAPSSAGLLAGPRRVLRRLWRTLSWRDACPACGSDASNLKIIGDVQPTQEGTFSVERFSLAHCSRCEVVRLRPTPTEADLRTMYQESVQFGDEHYTAPEQVERMLAYYGHCLDDYSLLPPPGGRSLEVGAGFAWVSRACKLRISNIETVAQDVSSECAEKCDWVDRYHVGPVTSLSPEPLFDLISLTHVIEHLVDPAQMLQLLAVRLSPGGRIFITAPYRPAGWTPEQGLAPWLEYSYLHVPAHISYLSEQWFLRVAESTGLTLIRWDATQDEGQAFEVILGR
jgi:SAM-dependent methyltransferase